MIKDKKNIKSFLVINPYGIGDVLFATPLIRNLKDNYPDSRIYFLCNKRTEFILRNNPLIEKIFVYDRDESVELNKRSKVGWLREFVKFISSIRKEKIDVSFDLSLNTYFGFISFLSGVKYRFGLDRKKKCVFLNRKLELDSFKEKHVSEYYLDLLREFGIEPNECGLDVYVDKENSDWADKFVESKGIASPIFGVAPMGGESWGSKAYLKRWPAQNFTKLIDEIAKSYDAKVFLFGGEGERDKIMSIKDSLNAPDRCFECIGLPFEKVIALIDKCELFIGNDTGLLRFADALGKKIVAFFGPVDERVYGMFPFYSEKHSYMTNDVACRPCYNDFKLEECKLNIECLNGISVERAVDAVKRLINTEVEEKI